MIFIVLGGGETERSSDSSRALLGEGERFLGLSRESERDLSRRRLTGERERERDTERARLLERRLDPLLDDDAEPELEPESDSESESLLSELLDREELLALESEAELSLLDVEAERLHG